MTADEGKGGKIIPTNLEKFWPFWQVLTNFDKFDPMWQSLISFDGKGCLTEWLMTREMGKKEKKSNPKMEASFLSAPLKIEMF